MNELKLKPDHDAGHGGDKQLAVPALAEAAHAAARRSGAGSASPRRRFRSTRLAGASDDGLRPFRIF